MAAGRSLAWLALAAFVAGAPARAAPGEPAVASLLPDPGARASAEPAVAYAVLRQPLAQALAAIARAGGLVLEVDPGVDGVLGPARLTGTAAEIVARLSRENGLYHYADGVRHVVVPARLVRLATIADRELDPAAAARAVRAVFPLLPAAALRITTEGALVVAGPDAVLAAARAAVAQQRSREVTVVRYGRAGAASGEGAGGAGGAPVMPSLSDLVRSRQQP